MTKLILFLLLLITNIEYSSSFTTKRLTMKDGLSQQSVLAISQDDKGRMIFGTSEGINIYDGHSIKVQKGKIKLPNKKSIWFGNYVTDIETDSHGNIFCISDNNLFFFNFKENRYDQLTLHENTIAITIQKNLLWFIEGNELKTFDSRLSTIKNIKTLPQKNYTSLVIGKNNLYVGSTEGLDIYTKELQLISSELKGKLIYRLFESSEEELWIGTGDNGLFRYKNQELSHVALTPHSDQGVRSLQIRDFLEDSAGNIWIANRTGLQKYDKRLKKYLLINDINLSGQHKDLSIYSLFQDKQNNIWIGTYHEGVCYFNPAKNKAEFEYEKQNTDQLIINNIQMDNNHNLWISDNSFRNGISCIGPDWQKIKSINTSNNKILNSDNIKSLVYHKGKNKLYIGLYMGGLAIYDLNTDRTQYYPLPDVSLREEHNNIIYHIEIWKEHIYVSTPQALYFFEEQTNSFKLITGINDYCNDFKITADSTIIARDKNSIQLIPLSDPKKKQTINLSDLGYKGEISRLLLNKDEVYILTLGSGIIRYNLTTKAIANYTDENSGLPSNYCYNAQFTKTNKIIFANELGVTLFDPTTRKFMLPNNSFRKAPIVRDNSLFVSDTNEIYVSNTNGITKLTEKDFEPIKNTISTLFFTKLFINNLQVGPQQENGILSTIMPYTQSLDLQTNQNNIRIEFAHTDYINEQVQQGYAYKLEGADKDWNTTMTPSVHYSNLFPGNYTLFVKLQNQEHSPIASLSIHIATPIYARWWAILLYVVTISLIIRTIYKYKTRQRELALSLKNERFEKHKIEQLNNEKLIFFTNVSHEFRTPLTLISSHADAILTQQNIPTAVYNMVYKLKKNADYMNNLISELLDFRKYSQHQSTLKLTEGDYEGFVYEIYLNFKEFAKRQDIKLDLQTSTSPIIGWFDYKALEKVLINLLSNAFKYTPKGGSITLSVSKEGNIVTTQVSDSGVGIAPDDIKHIFNRFYRILNQHNTEFSPGTGIGLALSKSIIDSHHGDISVESEEGKGSTFCFRFPIDKESYSNDEQVCFTESDMDNLVLPEENHLIDLTDTQLNSFMTNPLIDNVSENNQRKILLVEDNQELLLVLKHLFETQYQVILATNGKEGLEKATEYKPDLVISDVMMPEMNGTEMCTKIKNNIDLCHIPVILLTALGGFEQNLEGLSRGADDYITKPFNGQLLVARANNIIRNRLLIQSQINKKLVEEVDLSSINPLDQEILRKVEEILNKNLDNSEFDVSDLIKEIGMGRSALFAKFKALTGMTPNNYILNYRFKYAISLFHHHPELNISEVSDQCGFSSPSYFGKCFKKQYGTSPQAYKDQLCEKATASQGS